MNSSLHKLIDFFERNQELKRVELPVNTELELSSIVRKISSISNGGPALLFTKPLDFGFPVLANLFGSINRMQISLGLNSMDDLSSSFSKVLETNRVKEINQLAALFKKQEFEYCSPQTVSSPPCRQFVEPSPNLLKFPFIKNWPDDGSAAGSGRYITLGQVITTDPDGNNINCGIYRCQIHGPCTLAIRWRPGSGADLHHQKFVQHGRKMPVAIALGGSPAMTLAAAWPLPEGVDEFIFAGWLQGRRISVTDCSHSSILVPAEAELVIEGFADPVESLIEGPFGNHTGRYDPPGTAAKITVTRITRRNHPIIPITVVGPPPQEDCRMMLGWERLLSSILAILVPEVEDIRFPIPWVFRNSAIISIKDSSHSRIREVVHSLWNLPWFSNSRLLIIVNSERSLTEMQNIAWQVVNETEWGKDLIMDESGSRLAVDATGHAVGKLLQEDLSICKDLEKRLRHYGLADL